MDLQFHLNIGVLMGVNKETDIELNTTIIKYCSKDPSELVSLFTSKLTSGSESRQDVKIEGEGNIDNLVRR